MVDYPAIPPNDTQRLIAELVAYGKPLDEIARTANCTVEYVRVMKRSSLFMSMVREVKEQRVEAIRQEAREKIVSEARASVETIVGIRDDDGLDPKVRLAAASKLLDEAELRRGKVVQSESHRVSITLNPKQAELLEAVEVDGK